MCGSQFNLIALALQHTTQMTERCIVPCCLCIAGYKAMLKHMVDGLWHTALGAATQQFLLPHQPLWNRQFVGIPSLLSLLTQIKHLFLRSMVPLSTKMECPVLFRPQERGNMRWAYHLAVVNLWPSHLSHLTSWLAFGKQDPEVSPVICSRKCSNRQTIDSKGLRDTDYHLLFLG